MKLPTTAEAALYIMESKVLHHKMEAERCRVEWVNADALHPEHPYTPMEVLTLSNTTMDTLAAEVAHHEAMAAHWHKAILRIVED